jgi:hypothetical protein
MIHGVDGTRRTVINRRAFLRGTGGIALALPFLEGMPERSAWAQDAAPVFGLFIVAACGVVGKRFWPTELGPLTAEALAASEQAVQPLAAHAPNLLMVSNVNFPMNGPTNCGHAQGLAMSLTARPANGGGGSVASNGASVDMAISAALNPTGTDPLTLYAGNRRNGYIAERISFKGSGAGQVRSADDNPWKLYSKLITAGAGSGGGTPPPAPPPDVMSELATSRKSVNDFVRAEMKALLGRPELSLKDHERLDQHFQAIRDAEMTMTGMAAPTIGEACSTEGLDTMALAAMEKGFAFKMDGMIEEVAKLHMQLVAVAFACNINRVATLQWGDGTDATKYDVPSNKSLGWQFHYLSHRMQSNSASGSNATAEAAHAEVDLLRMKTFAAGLDAFTARGLQDKCFVLWTNHISDGPSHSFKNVPNLIYGSAGGYLKQGQYIEAPKDTTNNKLLNTLMTAAGMRKDGGPIEDFGEGNGTGQITEMLATG